MLRIRLKTTAKTAVKVGQVFQNTNVHIHITAALQKWLYKTSLSTCRPQSHSWESLFLPDNSKNKTRLYVWKRDVASSKSGAMCPTH